MKETNPDAIRHRDLFSYPVKKRNAAISITPTITVYNRLFVQRAKSMVGIMITINSQSKESGPFSPKTFETTSAVNIHIGI